MSRVYNKSKKAVPKMNLLAIPGPSTEKVNISVGYLFFVLDNVELVEIYYMHA